MFRVSKTTIYAGPFVPLERRNRQDCYTNELDAAVEILLLDTKVLLAKAKLEEAQYQQMLARVIRDNHNGTLKDVVYYLTWLNLRHGWILRRNKRTMTVSTDKNMRRENHDTWPLGEIIWTYEDAMARFNERNPPPDQNRLAELSMMTDFLADKPSESDLRGKGLLVDESERAVP